MILQGLQDEGEGGLPPDEQVPHGVQPRLQEAGDEATALSAAATPEQAYDLALLLKVGNRLYDRNNDNKILWQFH